MSWSVAVAGASGYAGGEALRICAQHPELEVGALCAHTSRGTLGEHHPHLRSLAKRELEENSAERLAAHDVIIFALPHGASAALAAEVARINPEAILVDLGADHRLENASDWDAYYGGDFAEPWEYGMPELIRAAGPSQRERLSTARRIAAPGCNASAVTFAAQPALASSLALASDISATLAVGYSGAGKAMKAHLMASAAFGSAMAYSAGGTHRHIPEIAQNLRAGGAEVHTLAFTPILVPMSRGILAVVTMKAAPGITGEEVRAAYAKAYANEPFFHVCEAPPATGDAVGANTALIWAALDRSGETITAMCAIDNLVKGTAGAAIQSLNLALGLDESTGLTVNGVAP